MANQFCLFGKLLCDGRWHSAITDSSQSERAPMPQSDLRQRHIAFGPAAVRGAACAVVAKSPVHLGTSELVARAIRQATIETQMPDGVCSLVTSDRD